MAEDYTIRGRTEEMERKETLVFFLRKLKRVNEAYSVATEEQKGLLLKACKGIFEELEKLGIPQVESESLVIGGSEFLHSLYENGGRLQGKPGEPGDEGDIKLILG